MLRYHNGFFLSRFFPVDAYHCYKTLSVALSEVRIFHRVHQTAKTLSLAVPLPPQPTRVVYRYTLLYATPEHHVCKAPPISRSTQYLIDKKNYYQGRAGLGWQDADGR